MKTYNGSKPCPHCGKTISANKEMCFAGVTEFGTLENFEAVQKAREAAAMDAAVLPAETGAIKPKRTRKPKAAAATESEPKTTKKRTTRAKKTVEEPVLV